MAGAMRVILALFLAAAAAAPAFATDYTVGDAQGWTTGVDYDTWASGKNFKVGDTLLFQYGGLHSVVEVTKSSYASCSSSSAITTSNDGSTKISLTDAGTRYFICGTPSHCPGGMKVSITTAAAGAGPGSPPAATHPPSGGSSDSPPSSGDSNSPPASGSTPSAPEGKNAAGGGGFGGRDVAVLGGMIGLGIALLG